MIDTLLALLKNNTFASGGLFLLVLGGLAASLRNIPARLWRFVRQRLVLQVQITSDDTAYEWLEEWVAKQPMTRKTKILRLVTRYIDDPERPGKTHVRPLLVPGEGEHMLRYEGAYVWLTLDREKLQMTGSASKFFMNTMTLRMFRGTRDKLEQLVEEARELYENRLAGLTKVYVNNQYGEWVVAAAKEVRRPDSLIFSGNLLDNLRVDVKRFLDRKEWYADMGIPHRRGYLLYGEPGNGKSSLVLMIAASLGKNVATLSLSNSELTDSTLHQLFLTLPQNSILCLEDIDAVFRGRDKQTENKLTFTGLLNALDGITASEGRVVFMTTNFRETLDAALIRPGRADVHVYIGNATIDQARQFFLRFFPGQGVATDFASRIGDGRYSMAALQEHLLRFENDMQGALATFPDVTAPTAAATLRRPTINASTVKA